MLPMSKLRLKWFKHKDTRLEGGVKFHSRCPSQGLARTLKPSVGVRETQARTVGAQHIHPQVKSHLCLESASKHTM